MNFRPPNSAVQSPPSQLSTSPSLIKSWVPLLKRLVPSSFAAVMMVASLKLGIWHPLENIAYGAMFRLRGSTGWDSRVVVINIDDASLSKLDRFPLPRRHYATLLNQLAQAEPNLVVMDIIFSEESPDDAQLVAAMKRHGSVVLAQAWDREGNPWISIPSLKQAAISTGHISTIAEGEGDGMTRTIQPQVQTVPALGLAAIQTYSMIWKPIQLPPPDQPLWINWSGTDQQIPHYSFADVITGRVSAQTFKDKVVVVGVSALGVDPLITPFHRNPPSSGVYLHATVINNLLQQNFLQLPNRRWLALFLLGGSVGFSVALTGRKLRFQLALWLGVCLSWAIACVLSFQVGYWLPVATPVALLSLTAIAVVLVDRQTLEIKNQALQTLAKMDGLTKIANRRHFDEYLNDEWKRLAREQLPLSVILCDVDFFKKYNDAYGHPAGDRCLQQVAQALRQSVLRPADLVARYGGEEFVVILPNTRVAGAVEVAERIRFHLNAMAIIHKASEASAHVSLSLGISTTIPTPELAPATLVSTADLALYDAKQQGRDRYCVRLF